MAGNRVLSGLAAHTALVGGITVGRHEGRNIVCLRDPGVGIYDPAQKTLVVFDPAALVALASIDLAADQAANQAPATNPDAYVARHVVNPPSRL